MSAEGTKWFNRLARLLREMPDDVEVMVHVNTIALCERGARAAEFERSGSADATPTLLELRTKHVYPCSESI